MSEAANQQYVLIPRSALITSICIHLAIPLCFLINEGLNRLGFHLFPEPKRISLQDVYQNYIQVDVVALPDNLMNERTSVDTTLPVVDKPAALPEPKPDAKSDEMTEPETSKKSAEEKQMAEKQEAAKKKAEAEKLAKNKKAEEEKARKKAEAEALKKLRADAEREAALKSLAEKSGKKGRAKLAGNKLSKGTAMFGMMGTAKDAYTALISQRVRDHFNIFPWQQKKGLIAVVYIEIFQNGRLKRKEIVKSSNNVAYDGAVLQAVEESQPFPLPEDMSLIADGIKLEFRPEN